jgi:hypothetical protein
MRGGGYLSDIVSEVLEIIQLGGTSDDALNPSAVVFELLTEICEEGRQGRAGGEHTARLSRFGQRGAWRPSCRRSAARPSRCREEI